MKNIILALLIISTILINGCSKLPEDLYDCNEDSDCNLMSKNLIKKECCEWDSINSKYKEWYQSKINKIRCDRTCEISFTTEAVCIENKCKLKQCRKADDCWIKE